MKNKDVEKKLIASLDDKSQVNPLVLHVAKAEIKYKKSVQHKRQVRFVVASCVFAVLCLAIVLPIVLSQTLSKGYETIEFSSMEEYFLNNDIQIKTFGEIYEKGNPSENEDVPNSISFPYKRIKCELVKSKSIDFCIEELYEYTNGIQINNYVVLNNNEKLEERFFLDFVKLDKRIVIKNIDISYSYDTVSQIGGSKFNYAGYEFYMSFKVQSEDDVIYHLQNFINFQ